MTLLSSSIVAVLIVCHCHCYVQYVIASCDIVTVAVLVGIIIISAVASLGIDVAILKMYRCNDDRNHDGKIIRYGPMRATTAVSVLSSSPLIVAINRLDESSAVIMKAQDMIMATLVVVCSW